MSFVLEALRNKPVGLWLLDDDSPFQDYSGYNRAGSATAAPNQHVSLINGASYSTVFHKNLTGQFTSPVFVQGQEHKSFSLEATLRSVPKTKGITVARTNLVSNPSAETNSTGWFTYAGNSGATSLSRLTTGGFVGTSYIRATWTTAQTAGADPVGGIYGGDAPVTPGLSYSIRSAARTSRNNQSLKLTIEWLGTTASIGSTVATVAADTWTEFNVVSAIAPAGATNARVTVYSDSSGLNWALNDTLDVDAVIVEQTSSPVTYFDGDTLGAQWNGTPHASTSTLLVSVAKQKILGPSSRMDGLIINGNAVEFSTAYTEGTVTATHVLNTARAVHLVGVHSKNKNSLYVDGELVSEVDIPETYTAFLATDGNLYSGDTTSSAHLALNGVAIYANALSPESVSRHALLARNVTDAEGIVSAATGLYLPVSEEIAKHSIDVTWSDQEDWNTGVFTETSVVDSTVVPEFSSGVSRAGNWLTSVALDSTGETSMYGLSLDWTGAGEIIEASLDGTTWETAKKQKNLAIIPSGFIPTDKELFIRVSFSGGILDDPAHLSHLRVLAISSSALPNILGRNITLTNASLESQHPHLQMDNDWGTEINSGGSMVISADTTPEAIVPRTIELWMRADSETRPTISVAGTTYQNGLPNSTALIVGQWTLMHIVASADITGSITITGPGQVGHVGLYQNALTAAQIADIYDEYVGRRVTVVGDNSVLSITEQPVAANIYAHDWSIISAG